jgi:predicted PurR-regulated permease PerM
MRPWGSSAAAGTGPAASAAGAASAPIEVAAHVDVRGMPGPSPRMVWRSGLVLLAVVALGSFGWFVLTDAGSALFTIIMAWFTSITMEPAVRRLERRMRRGTAVMLVMTGAALFLIVFALAFGRLFLDQVASLLRGLPGVVERAIGWVNDTFSTSYSRDDLQRALSLTPQDVAGYADDVVFGFAGVIAWVAHSFLRAFTAVFLVYYFAADGPRLRTWIARLLPRRWQRVFGTTWDLTTIKTGGYVSARVVLAAINGSTSALVFWLIGMPSWLALGVWTGLVAQFVPTIGTYISIILPVFVGLLSPNPWIGVAALVWAIVYQQVENLTIEPRISAKAVDVHPAVSFASVMIGTALFGVAGALLSIPVAAVILALVDIYVRRHELLPELEPPPVSAGVAGAAREEAAPIPPSRSNGSTSMRERLPLVRRRRRAQAHVEGSSIHPGSRPDVPLGGKPPRMGDSSEEK